MKKIIFGLMFVAMTLVADGDWPYVCQDLKEFADNRYFGVASSQAYPLILADNRSISIDKKNKTIKVWTIWLASEQGRLARIESLGKYDDYSNYGYGKDLFIINYNTMKSAGLGTARYNCNGSVITTSNYQADWDEISPGSVMEGIVDSLVKKYKLK